MKKLILYLLPFCILPFLYYCAPPDVFGPGSDSLNPPMDVKIYSYENLKIRFEVTGYNTLSNAAYFAGYNIYIGEYANSPLTRFRRILSKNGDSPTIPAYPGSFPETHTFDLGIDDVYTNLNPAYVSNDYTMDELIRTHKVLYFLVKSYESLGGNESSQVLEYEICLSYKQLNQTLPIGSSLVYTNLNVMFRTFSNSGVFLDPQGSTMLIDAGYQDSWHNISHAPVSGYTAYPFPMTVGHVYIFNSDQDYGKLYIQSITPSNVSYHFSYQIQHSNI